MKYFIAIAFLCFQCMVAYTQNNLPKVENVIQKVSQTYTSSPTYMFDMKYELYQDKETLKVEESYLGKVIRNHNNYYSKIHHTEFVQFEDSNVKINHDEKAILYLKDSLKTTKTVFSDIVSLIGQFKDVSIRQNNEVFICEFIAKDVTLLSYSKVVLYINKNDYTIQKQVMYLSNAMVFKDQNGNQTVSNPRLEISFSKFNHKIDGNQKLLAKASYITNVGHNITTSSELSTYELINISKN